MTLDAGFSYVETEDQNMLSAGRYFNPLTSLYTYPRGESVEDLMMFEIYDSNKKRYVQNWAWSRGALDMQNPLWMMHRNIQNNKRRRSMMNASLTYKVTDWLTLAGRAKADLSVGESSRKLYASTDPLFAGGDNGFFEFTKEEDTHRYGDFIATVNKHWEQFSLFANVGASISDQLSSIAGARGPLELPNFFSLTNTNPYGASGQRLQERKREQEQAVFASVEAGWRGMLYLTATVRNEWHSNLAYTDNLSYCFPSVGLSGLIHEMVKLPSFIDYLKVRASWAEVGSPILWGISYLTYKWFVVHERHQTDPESPPGEHDLVGGGSERPTVRQFALAGLHLLQVQHQTPDLPRAPVWFGRLRKHVRADGQRRKQGFRAFDRIRQDMEGLRVELQPHAQPQQEQGRRADEQLLRPADGQIPHAQGV